MIGTAEDHHSNPMKIAISKFKREAAALSRSTPCAPATRRSLTSGFRSGRAPMARCFMALMHELIAQDLIDHAFLKRYTNAPQLVVLDEGEREGLFAFDPAAGPPPDGRNPHNKLVWDNITARQSAPIHKVSRPASNLHCKATIDCATALESRRRCNCSAKESRTALPNGPRTSPAYRTTHPTISARLRRRQPHSNMASSYRSHGPTRGVSNTRPHRPARSRFMRCADWPHTRTDFKRCVRWRSNELARNDRAPEASSQGALSPPYRSELSRVLFSRPRSAETLR